MSRRAHIKRAKLLRGMLQCIFPSSAAKFTQVYPKSRGYRRTPGKRIKRAWTLASQIRGGYPTGAAP